MKYAAGTEVSADRSRSEIERTLNKYGASGFMYGWQGSSVAVAFEMKNRRVRFVLPLEDKTDRKFTHTPGRNTLRSESQALAEWEKSTRQKWRALALCIKAKLESVESGIATFEEEFLAHIILPNNQTIGSWMVPQIEAAYQAKKMPPLLGSGSK